MGFYGIGTVLLMGHAGFISATLGPQIDKMQSLKFLDNRMD